MAAALRPVSCIRSVASFCPASGQEPVPRLVASPNQGDFERELPDVRM